MESKLRSGKKYKSDTIVFYDLETTGFNPYHDNIIEIGAIKIVNNIETKFNRLVCINRPLPKRISELTNISNNDLENQPTIEIVIKEFIQFINGGMKETIFLVAHNNDSFDRLFLENAISKIDLKLHFNLKYIDTLRFSQKLLPERFSYSLSSLCKYYEINQENFHRAYDDAYNLYLLYKKLCAIYSMNSCYSYKYLLFNPSTISDYIKI